MFNFLKVGKAFNDLAKAMNGMNSMLDELIPKIERSYDYSEFGEEVLILAYIGRKGILNRMEEYNWGLDAKIIVPTIDRGRITLMYAYTRTIGRLQMIATKLELSELVEDIMAKGETYYELENKLLEQVTKNI